MNEITTLEQLQEITSKTKTIAYFSAPWCGPCRSLGPIVEELSTELSDVQVVKINIDDSTEIPAKYAIRSVPTLILIEHEQEKKRLVGTRSKTDVKKEFEL